MSEAPSINAIILAAVGATGPKPAVPAKPAADASAEAHATYERDLAGYGAALSAWDQAVKSNARDIRVMASPRSKISRQLAGLNKALDENSSEGKVFTGTVVSVIREQSSTRGLVTLFTGTEQANAGLPAGQESVRTERTDDPDGKAIARQAQLLIGHRVTVYIELEAIRGGATKVRVLRHLDDLGVDPNFEGNKGAVKAA